ncbi:MAG: hypothetical protein AAGB93_20275 [Planctomycetota bacterium]
MKKKTSRVETSGPGELTHNPFAALRGRLGEGAKGGEAPVVDGGSSEPYPGPDGGTAGGGSVVVRRERKGRGGRTVTIAAWSGRGAPEGEALEALARDLGKRLGCGARVEDGAVVVQGALVDRLAAILETEHGARVTRGTD